MELDLDKARAARLATKGEGHTFTFGGAQFTLPPEMPYVAAEMIEQGNFRAALSNMLNGTAEKFFELDPSTDDMEALITGMTEMYVPGTSLGESSASSPSSTKGSTKPRQPSSANTAST